MKSYITQALCAVTLLALGPLASYHIGEGLSLAAADTCTAAAQSGSLEVFWKDNPGQDTGGLSSFDENGDGSVSATIYLPLDAGCYFVSYIGYQRIANQNPEPFPVAIKCVTPPSPSTPVASECTANEITVIRREQLAEIQGVIALVQVTRSHAIYSFRVDGEASLSVALLD